ncbi:acyltransferase family protein [Undibacterium terreum]|uniref:acyltransferase family protein n=1 Tax=Undibacterium terreum TaxID=1224302 RepID=UPI001662B8A7|nr:acyltransferase [Undibacterium terreum]
MNNTFSTYLDAIRFLAALTVMAAHMTFKEYTGGNIPYQGAWAGAAVVVFFVLSGYVIRFVSKEKETTLTDYAVSRMARIYSVAIPAILLTMLLDGICYFLGTDKPLPAYQYLQLWKYMPLFLAFLTDVGPFHEGMLTDVAFWSLSYEVWYYVLFAIVVYWSGWKKWALAAILLVALGIPILIYLPIWLIGVGLYELHQRVTVKKMSARIMFALSFLGLFAIRLTGADDMSDEWMSNILGGYPEKHLHNSQHFLGHYMIAAVMTTNLFAAKYAELDFLNKPWLRKAIVYLASFTFALYLAHRPLMDFYLFVFHHNPHSFYSVVGMVVFALLGSWLFGLGTEHKKQWWKNIFTKLIKRTPRLGMVPATQI